MLRRDRKTRQKASDLDSLDEFVTVLPTWDARTETKKSQTALIWMIALAWLIRTVDRPFAVCALTFGVGTLIGFVLSVSVPALRYGISALLLARVMGPLRTAELMGGIVVVGLIFANNALPVLLSFLYPILLTRIRWSPPLTEYKRKMLLSGYSLLAAFLLGFFDLGATLGSVLFERGAGLVISLLNHSWLHGPIEFFLILLSVSEPSRIALREDTSSPNPFTRTYAALLLLCLFGLLTSAVIEFALNI